MPELAAVVIAGSLGAMIFFSAAIAPTVFQALPEDHAGNFLRAIFPKYFMINGLLAGVAALMLMIAGLPVLGVVLVIAAAAMFAVRYLAIPRINAARDASLAGDSGAKTRFDQLHRATVLINLGEMLALAVVLFLLLG